MENKIETLCRDKEKELLKKYFVQRKDGPLNPYNTENIGEYTLDLPERIETEFRCFLETIWKEISNKPLVLEERKLRDLYTASELETLKEAYKKATKITFWEKITKTNHEDITFYKGLLKKYTADLLMIMRIDFLEEITGKHINCKAFED